MAISFIASRTDPAGTSNHRTGWRPRQVALVQYREKEADQPNPNAASSDYISNLEAAMSRLPEHLSGNSLSPINAQFNRTARAIQTVRHDAIVAAARAQAIEYVTNEAVTSALGIAMTEAACAAIAPHAAGRFRVIAEAGTQALVLHVLRQSGGCRQ